MKYFLLLFTGLFFHFNSSSQNLFLYGFAGISTYEGDLQQSFTTFTQAKTVVGAGVSYSINDHIFVRTGLMQAKVSGTDKKNPKLAYRNLNFTSSITEIQLALEYYLFNFGEKKLSPYIFAGIAGFHFNPYTTDTAGTKYFLQPLSTEGQGFYNGRKPYTLNAIAIPFGGGIKWAATENIFIGVEGGARKLFTDYLDDVSSTYADPNLILANRGAKALELAYRGGEINPSATYPSGLLKRGEASKNDFYIFSGITLTYRFHQNEGRQYRPKNRSSRRQTGCPTRVY